jgi:hypothetical protein
VLETKMRWKIMEPSFDVNGGVRVHATRTAVGLVLAPAVTVSVQLQSGHVPALFGSWVHAQRRMSAMRISTAVSPEAEATSAGGTTAGLPPCELDWDTGVDSKSTPVTKMCTRAVGLRTYGDAQGRQTR